MQFKIKVGIKQQLIRLRHLEQVLYLPSSGQRTGGLIGQIIYLSLMTPFSLTITDYQLQAIWPHNKVHNEGSCPGVIPLLLLRLQQDSLT